MKKSIIPIALLGIFLASCTICKKDDYCEEYYEEEVVRCGTEEPGKEGYYDKDDYYDDEDWSEKKDYDKSEWEDKDYDKKEWKKKEYKKDKCDDYVLPSNR